LPFSARPGFSSDSPTLFGAGGPIGHHLADLVALAAVLFAPGLTGSPSRLAIPGDH